MAVYRNIVGTITDAQGDNVAAGKIKVKPLTPVVDANVFISPEEVVVNIADGSFTLTLVAPCIYQFIVEDQYEESMWSFQATLSDDSSADISIAALYYAGRIEMADDITPITTWLELLDTPDSYEGHAGKTLVVNVTEDGIEFV